MKKSLFWIGVMMPMCTNSAPLLNYFTLGPIIHWNSSSSGIKLSGGFEASYWTYRENSNLNLPNIYQPGYGIDMGFEFERAKFRVYCEPEMSWMVEGASLGPVFEYRRVERNSGIGFQCSLWPLWLPIVDFRYRITRNEETIAPGVFAKIPLRISY